MVHKPTIPTEAPADTKTRKCPQCGEWKPLPHFSYLPADARCDVCLPPLSTEAAVLYDKRVDLAQKKMAKIFDASERATNLEPLERVVKAAYDAWGGPNSFAEDIVEWIKNLADKGKYAQAINAGLQLMKIHGRIDKMKQEEEWQAMDDPTVRATLQAKLASLFASQLMEEEGQKVLDSLIGKVKEDEDAQVLQD